MDYISENSGFKIVFDGMEIIRHSNKLPFLTVGTGNASYKMYHGIFNIRDSINEAIPLENFAEEEKDGHIVITFIDKTGKYSVKAEFIDSGSRLIIKFKDETGIMSRLWVKIPSNGNEHIYGCGEQFTDFDLKGKRVKVWVAEHQNIKRLIGKVISRKLHLKDRVRRFEHYTSYYCAPIFLSSRKYFLYADNYSYMEFNFKNKEYLEIKMFGMPDKIIIGKGETFEALLQNLTDITGRRGELPQWVYSGVILGIQGGTECVLEKLKKAQDAGMPVSAVWAQDWEGRRITSFGKQLMWDWKWDEKLYPGLDREILSLKEKGIRFLGYINPFLAIEGGLYREASSKGYLVKNREGGDYLVKITTFPAAMVDLTNPDAFKWIKYIIRKNMIDFGLSGWMADFGEYLPADGVLYNGRSTEEVHNIWPVLWAKANKEAVDESGEKDIIFFTRSGFVDTPSYSPLVWTGDQHVDWSMDDGLPSVIPALLSLSVSGCGISHSDIGGYTTLPGITRSKEVFLRWAEMAAFSPVMRTHEGNRPDDNWQFDSDEECLKSFARLAAVYKTLSPYTIQSVKEYNTAGVPVIRPLYMHYDEEKCYTSKYEYLYGRDLLVAPVIKKGAEFMDVYLPEDNWVHLWTGKAYTGGKYRVECPIGYPPVFYRYGSHYMETFKEIQKL